MNIVTLIFKKIINGILSFINLEMKRIQKIPITFERKIDDILDLEDKIFNFNNELILIYQMGKVASSTIHNSLLKRGFNAFHFHHLNDITSSQLEYIIKHDYTPTNYIEEILRGNLRSKFLLNRIFLNDKTHVNRIKIISLTREPISYLISSFFQNYSSFYSYYFDKSNLTDKYSLKNIKSLKRYFLDHVDRYLEIYYGNDFINDDNYKEIWKNQKNTDLRHFLFLCRWPLIWFDREMNKMFNFDIFNSGFDKESGYDIYKGNGISKLIIKMERFEDVGKKQIGKFINDDGFEIVNKNIGREKVYNDLYKEFCSSIVLPKEFVEYQYSSKYAKFFYTDGELNGFIHKWASFI